MKFLLLVLICTTIFTNYLNSLNFECNFNSSFDYQLHGKVYRCGVRTDPNITSEEMATVTSISGTHQSGKTNDDVLSFHAYFMKIMYFPRGLDLIFKNLKVILIEGVKLKEVHQSDLKPFPQLEFLCLAQNDIQTLEEDLFEFNKNLKVVMFYKCKITHIDPNVFDNLSKLSYLLLTTNICIDEEARNDTTKVAAIVKKIQNGQCINPAITKKPTTTTEVITTTTTSTTSQQSTSTETTIITEPCLALEAKIDEIGSYFMDFVNSTNLQCKTFEEKLISKCDANLQCQTLNEKALNLEHSMFYLKETTTKISSDLVITNQEMHDFVANNNHNNANLNEKVDNIGKKLEYLEEKLVNLERNVLEILQAVKQNY